MDETINKYNVELNGVHYYLTEAQYRAYYRKKDMPIDRLVIWLELYKEENKSIELWQKNIDQEE